LNTENDWIIYLIGGDMQRGTLHQLSLQIRELQQKGAKINRVVRVKHWQIAGNNLSKPK
jgi:hypothetical protein